MSHTLPAVIRSTRPNFLVLAPICVLLGISSAYHAHGNIAPQIAVLVIIAAISAHISVNTFNEYLDFTSGLDETTKRTPFSGGSGALPEFPSAQVYVLTVAVATLFLTTCIGVYLVSLKGLTLFLIGVLGVFIIIFYTRWINRYPLLCPLAPGVSFGPLFVVGTYISVSGSHDVSSQSIVEVLTISLVPFFLVNNLLLLNQLPDVEADRLVGRKTFPIAYGLDASMKIYAMFAIGASLSMAGVALRDNHTHWSTLIAVLPLIFGYQVYWGVKKERFIIEQILPYMATNVKGILLTILLYAAVLAIS